MRGSQPAISDISEELQELVCPVNLECDEELAPENDDPYAVAVACHKCGNQVAFCVYAPREGIRQFQQLLLDCLDFCCPACSLNLLQRNGL
ncbi:E7 protein [Bos taurus papillomavirus 12]|uniref:Protein E7 n=1 Tax=Bos taurus papillomavirus 12 TaxID=1070324 RepID=G1CR69_9PAPI|nr:E7 protein [Bos taurus papillomavirus 12]AEL99906.1 E7 protein [Bos taurus papillomavirus 12]